MARDAADQLRRKHPVLVQLIALYDENAKELRRWDDVQNPKTEESK